MAAMDNDPFQTDPVLQRAAGYPYDITQTSFTFIEGEAAPFDPALTRGRYPVIGYGSNQSPQRLRQKYGTTHAPIPVQRGRLADHDVVYSAHFSSYGSLPAALRYVEGTTVSVAVNWLDDTQLAAMHPTESDNYHYARLTDISLQLEEGEALAEAYAYLSFRGHTAHDGEPIALTYRLSRGGGGKSPPSCIHTNRSADVDARPLGAWYSACRIRPCPYCRRGFARRTCTTFDGCLSRCAPCCSRDRLPRSRIIHIALVPSPR